MFVWCVFSRGAGTVFVRLFDDDAATIDTAATVDFLFSFLIFLLLLPQLHFFFRQAFDNFCKIVFFMSFVFFFWNFFLFIRVVEKFTRHIICDNCRLRSYRLFSLYQICSVFQTVFPFDCMWFYVMQSFFFLFKKWLFS